MTLLLLLKGQSGAAVASTPVAVSSGGGRRRARTPPLELAPVIERGYLNVLLAPDLLTASMNVNLHYVYAWSIPVILSPLLQEAELVVVVSRSAFPSIILKVLEDGGVLDIVELEDQLLELWMLKENSE